MESVKYLIIGAGPAGLAFANMLKASGEDSFLVLEKESEAGGLCRSSIVDGAPLDTGGGHFLDVRDPEVVNFVFSFLPEEEWDRYDRISRIDLGNAVIDYPFESNIWQLPEDEQVKHLVAISRAGCNLGKEKPELFSKWIPWKLGEKIASDYMLPYNSKMWCMDLDEIGTYWLEKLPDVSFEDTLLSCIRHSSIYESLPGHASFYYPKKHGYGKVWLEMADAVKDNMIYDTKASELDLDGRTVNGHYKGEYIINTAPWTDFDHIDGAGEAFMAALQKLKFTSVVIKYYDETVDTDSHWTYFPEESKEYHRILYRSNFCRGSKGYWTESNVKRADINDGRPCFVNEYAYPVNTTDKRQAIALILEEAEKKNVYGLGRWGQWEHFNSDVTVKKAMQLALRFGKGN
ncbi:MAG: NAD(P)-binding protein [Lachnospiraceae bacterium]|nr:NAD(P)-binding protein [Lachnospiraceae bacterium]